MTADLPRRPAIFLAVILPLLLLGVPIAASILEAYAHVEDTPLSAVPRLNAAFIVIPAFFLWMPFALLLGNEVLHAVPRLRRIAEHFATRTNRPGFADTQSQLLRLAVCFAAVCVPLIVVGFMI